MVGNAVLPDVLKEGFNLMKLMGVHPQCLYVGIVPILHVGQYLVIVSINIFLFVNEVWCSDTLEDAVENVMAVFSFLSQVNRVTKPAGWQ